MRRCRPERYLVRSFALHFPGSLAYIRLHFPGSLPVCKFTQVSVFDVFSRFILEVLSFPLLALSQLRASSVVTTIRQSHES